MTLGKNTSTLPDEKSETSKNQGGARDHFKITFPQAACPPHLPLQQILLKNTNLGRDERMRFSGLKISKYKGANTEITMDLKYLLLADVGILSYDLRGNSACSRDLFCKGDHTRIPYGLGGCRAQGKGVRRGHLDLTFSDCGIRQEGFCWFGRGGNL